MSDSEVGQAARGGEDLVEVQERLAHPHVDDVVHRLVPSEVECLVEDLEGREVPAEPHRSRRAERARERAAGLGREAERSPPVAVAHEHGLDRVAVLRAEERLHRPVLRLALGDDLERRERHRLGEVGAQRLRKRRHLLVGRDAARSPLPHLARAVGGLALLGESAFEEREIHCRTVACAA